MHEVPRPFTRFLSDISSRLDPIFGERDWVTKYGSEVHQKTDDAELMMRPFCWCENEDCPWCTGEPPEDADDKLRTRFEASHFIAGQGAPNFYFRSPAIEVSIWWYKYLGRDMESSISLGKQEIKSLKGEVQAFMQANRKTMLSKRLIEDRDRIAPKMDANAYTTIIEALLASLPATPNDTDVARLVHAVLELEQLNFDRVQVQRAEAMLDDVEIPRTNPQGFGLTMLGRADLLRRKFERPRSDKATQRASRQGKP